MNLLQAASAYAEFKKGEDPVNHPPHYQTPSGVECLQIINELGFGYFTGNALKYLWRHKKKGRALEDLRKCRFYIDREIEQLEKQ